MKTSRTVAVMLALGLTACSTLEKLFSQPPNGSLLPIPRTVPLPEIRSRAISSPHRQAAPPLVARNIQTAANVNVSAPGPRIQRLPMVTRPVMPTEEPAAALPARSGQEEFPLAYDHQPSMHHPASPRIDASAAAAATRRASSRRSTFEPSLPPSTLPGPPRPDGSRPLQPLRPTSEPLPQREFEEPYEDLEGDIEASAAIPKEFVPWWQPETMKPLRRAPARLRVDVNSLIVDALQYSSRVRAISDNALISETGIVEAEAEFDVHAFMESKFVRTSLPTGSTLEAGFNVPRLREEDWFYNAGLRKKNQMGGRFEIAQRIGTRDSNSQFFTPENQGNSRLTLSYNQPILNGAGKAYNTSIILLASLDTRIADDRTAAELQDHLLEVTEAMWQLYQERSILLQKRRHLSRAQVIFERLASRSDFDAMQSQIKRARAAVAMRRAELIRATTSIRNAEARVRALVNSPMMLANHASELVPAQTPMRDTVPIDLSDAFVTALQNRPEIDAAMQEIEAARIRMNMAKNELMPALDLVLETYVSGLRGDYGIGRSFADQFSVGEPSYTAGLIFEVPLHRRAAKVRYQRRNLELRQLTSRLQATVERLNAEVEIAVREVDTAYRELLAKYTSMDAAQADLDYLQRRWELRPDDDRAASFLLEDLLDAQDRLANEESGFARAQVQYTLSLTRLNRSTGTLLRHEQIHLMRTCDGCLPGIQFERFSVATEDE